MKIDEGVNGKIHGKLRQMCNSKATFLSWNPPFYCPVFTSLPQSSNMIASSSIEYGLMWLPGDLSASLFRSNLLFSPRPQNVIEIDGMVADFGQFSCR